MTATGSPAHQTTGSHVTQTTKYYGVPLV